MFLSYKKKRILSRLMFDKSGVVLLNSKKSYDFGLQPPSVGSVGVPSNFTIPNFLVSNTPHFGSLIKRKKSVNLLFGITRHCSGRAKTLFCTGHFSKSELVSRSGLDSASMNFKKTKRFSGTAQNVFKLFVPFLFVAHWSFISDPCLEGKKLSG